VGKAGANLVIHQDTSENTLSGGSTQAVLRQDIAEIYFAKGDVLEVIRITGPGADAGTVTGLARTAAARIP